MHVRLLFVLFAVSFAALLTFSLPSPVSTEFDPASYDADGNCTIEREEVVAAVKDYFADLITRNNVIEVVKLYFSGAPVCQPDEPLESFESDDFGTITPIYFYYLLEDARNFYVSVEVEVPRTIYPACWGSNGQWSHHSHRYCDADALGLKDDEEQSRMLAAGIRPDQIVPWNVPLSTYFGGSGFGLPPKHPGKFGFLFRHSGEQVYEEHSYVGTGSDIFHPKRWDYAERPAEVDWNGLGTKEPIHPWAQKMCYAGFPDAVLADGPSGPVTHWSCYQVFYQASGVGKFGIGGSVDWPTFGYKSSQIVHEFINPKPTLRGESGQVNTYELTVTGDTGVFAVNGHETPLDLSRRAHESGPLFLVTHEQELVIRRVGARELPE